MPHISPNPGKVSIYHPLVHILASTEALKERRESGMETSRIAIRTKYFDDVIDSFFADARAVAAAASAPALTEDFNPH